jgi:hypothetical protein
VQQQLIRFHLPLAEGPVERLDHQGGIHPLFQCPAEDAVAELRWSGFSGQPPSLTSEAGHHP